MKYIETCIVRHGDLIPDRSAFIDAHTPGSNLKENYTIIGDGVSESADRHVHIKETPGFNIGGAGQPPKCTNSLHIHRTAEVFFILSGRWRFFWGNNGKDGEVILEAGDVINIPTGIFRGFENIGTEYSMVMAVLGGDDSGGGVIWAPKVIEDAKDHGLILGNNGVLFDAKKNQTLPEGINPMKPLTDEELSKIPEVSTADFVPRFVARYLDMLALSDHQPALVIGDKGMIHDQPGFTLELVSKDSLSSDSYTSDQHEVFMVMKGYWNVTLNKEKAVISPGDVFAVAPGLERSLSPSRSNHASIFRVRKTDDKAGPTIDFP